MSVKHLVQAKMIKYNKGYDWTKHTSNADIQKHVKCPMLTCNWLPLPSIKSHDPEQLIKTGDMVS